MHKSPYSVLNDRSALLALWNETHNASEIARRLGYHYQTVGRALLRLGIVSKRAQGKRIPLLDDRDALQAEVNRKPLRLISEEQGCSYSRVRTAVINHGIEIPRREQYNVTVDKSKIAKEAIEVRGGPARGARTGNWRGGVQRRGAYVYLHRDLVAQRWPDHPRLARKDWSHCQEHILVVEAREGRCLTEGEVVHHDNEIKDDNRPENLFIKRRGEHVSDHWLAGKNAKTLRRELSAARKLIDKYRQMLLDAGINPDENED